VSPGATGSGPGARPLPHLVICYDDGAASPREIVQAVAGLAHPTFVLRDDAKASRIIAALRDVAHVVPYTSPRETADAIRAHRAPDGIVTFSERMLPVTTELAQRLSLPFHSADVARRLTSKTLQRRALRDAGVENLRFQHIKTVADIGRALESVGTPAVIKPEFGEGSHATYRIDDATAAARLMSAPPVIRTGSGLQVEEFLPGRGNVPFGDYISVESVTISGTATHLAVTGKFPLVAPFREVGQVWPPRLRPGEETEARNITGRALAALGVRTGLTHTELKLTESGPRIIEVNGRLGGFVEDLASSHGNGSLISLACAVALAIDAEIPDFTGEKPVVFNFSNLPPLDARQLIGVEGARLVRHLPGLRYKPLMRPGAMLTAGVGAAELDLISGKADSYQEMFDSLRAAVSQLVFRFKDLRGAEISVQGSSLPSGRFLFPDPTST
jgi:carbamoylphosphate synthase large subunit